MDSTTKLSIPLNHLSSSENALLVSPVPPGVSVLPIANPTSSFWLTPDNNPLLKHNSQGHLSISEADVCIIGSGITGVSAAYHLSKMGMGDKKRVVILEARDFCSVSENLFMGSCI